MSHQTDIDRLLQLAIGEDDPDIGKIRSHCRRTLSARAARKTRAEIESLRDGRDIDLEHAQKYLQAINRLKDSFLSFVTFRRSAQLC